MSRSLVVAAIAAAASLAGVPLAAADPDAPVVPPHEAPPASTTTASRPQLALAVNPPFRWKDGAALAASVYVGFGQHHAIRANVARYDYTSGTNVLIGDLFFGGDGDDASRDGRYMDVGASYTYFPRKLWSGLMLEAGVFVRDSDTVTDDEFASPEYVEVHSKTFGARGHIGWSWLVHNRVFVSVAVGIARGHEIGKEVTSKSSYDLMLETHDISRAVMSGEGFVRIGGVIDL